MPYKITCREAIDQVLGEIREPLPEAEFIARVLKLWPSQARNAAQSVKNEMRYGHPLVRLAEGRIAPSAWVFNGVQFRLQLNAEERDQGQIDARRFTGFVKEAFPYARLHLQDTQTGREIPHRIVDITPSNQDRYYYSRAYAVELRAWLRTVGYQAEDSLILQVQDYDRAAYTVRHEPAADRRQADIERQNEALAQAVYGLLSRRRSAYLHEFVPQLYAELPSRRDYPGDPWSVVVRRDERFGLDGYLVHLGRSTLPAFGRIAGFPPDEAIEALEQAARQLAETEWETRLRQFQERYEAERDSVRQELPPVEEEAELPRLATRRLALRRSQKLIDRFRQHLRAERLSRSSQDQKVTDLQVLSEYLAEQGRLTLEAANFDRLEDFFFRWYPHPMNRNGRSVTVLKRMFTTFEQFYQFLEEKEQGPPSLFASALKKLRPLAVEKFELAQGLPKTEEFADLQARWFGQLRRRWQPLHRVRRWPFPFGPFGFLDEEEDDDWDLF